MKAERDYKLAGGIGKQNELAKWGVALLFGCAITAAMLTLASGSMGKNSPTSVAERLANQTKKQGTAPSNSYSNAEKEDLRNWWKKDEEHWERSTQAAQKARQEQAEIVWTKEMLDELNEQEAENNKQKQTDFHDGNYVPRGAINIVDAKSFGETEPPKVNQQRQKPQEIVVVGKAESRLRDFCPHKPGTVEHRNCKMRADLQSRNRN